MKNSYAKWHKFDFKIEGGADISTFFSKIVENVVTVYNTEDIFFIFRRFFKIYVTSTFTFEEMSENFC